MDDLLLLKQLSGAPPLRSTIGQAPRDIEIHARLQYRKHHWYIAEYDPASFEAFGFQIKEGEAFSAGWEGFNVMDLTQPEQYGRARVRYDRDWTIRKAGQVGRIRSLVHRMLER
jgi:hypothetical protein